MINVKISKKVFNSKYLPYLNNQDRYLIFYGGGSSGKSYYIVQRWVYKLISEKMNLLVCRQTGDTNRNSTFALFKQVVNTWHLESLFNITDLRIKCINGNEVIFKGLDDIEKVKSVTFDSGELTHIWIEEATETAEYDVNQLKVRLRGGTSKKQMVLSFNPVNVNHWIKRHFVDGKVEKATVCHSTYKDNKFLTEEDKNVLENFKKIDPYYYDVYCLGLWGVLGKTYFNARKINERLKNIKEPISQGYFKYEFDNQTQKIKSFYWVEDPEGFIKIYEKPQKRYPYVLGGDTSGEGSDYFTGHVINNITGKQVAVLKKEFDEIEYTRQIYCLGKYYNNALIGLEANFSTYPIHKLDELGYEKQFIREVEDSYTNKREKRYGFKTTAITRPLILADLQKIVLEEIEKLEDKETLEEMLTFVRNEKGRPEAQENAHDDLVMGLAITYYIRAQQTFKLLPIEVPEEQLVDYSEFGVRYDQRLSDDDFGSNIEII